MKKVKVPSPEMDATKEGFTPVTPAQAAQEDKADEPKPAGQY